MTEWTEERCAERPAEIQTIASNKLIQRKGIQQVDHPAEDGQPAYTEYVCQCRKLSAAEYAEILKEKSEATDAYIDMVLSAEEE